MITSILRSVNYYQCFNNDIENYISARTKRIGITIDVLVTALLVTLGTLGQCGIISISNELSMGLLYSASGYALIGLAFLLGTQLYIKKKIQPLVEKALICPEQHLFLISYNKNLLKAYNFVIPMILALFALGLFISGFVDYYHNFSKYDYQTLTYTAISVANLGVIILYSPDIYNHFFSKNKSQNETHWQDETWISNHPDEITASPLPDNEYVTDESGCC